MWLELGDLLIRFEHHDERLLGVLTAVALTTRFSPAASSSATVELLPCTKADIADQTPRSDPLIASDSTQAVPPTHLYVGDGQITAVLPEVGFARALSDWREVRLAIVPEHADTLAARALTALVLQDLAAHYGYFAIHASMVERDGQGVLFCGERARGKSTSCLAMGRAGWAVRSDDRCYVRTEPLSVWGSTEDMRLREDVVEIWDDLRGPLERGIHWTSKKRVLLTELVEESGPGFARPAALFFPRVDDRERHEVQVLSSADALQELLCATGVSCLPSHTATHFSAIADLVEATPSYRLYLSPDMSALPALIEETTA